MLSALIVTLREGVEAALIVGIVLAYLTKINRPDLRRSVYAALISAFVASVGVAVVLARANLNQDVFEGWVMLVAAFFVISMVIFMMRTARHLKGEIEGKLGELASRSSHFGVFAFVFLMVLREGVETVLILAAVELSSSQLLSFLGTLVGVVISIVFGVMFVKGSVRINLGRFFRVTSVILVFVALQLLVSGLHELSESGVLRSSKQEMAMIGPIVRNDIFFFVTILALAALMVLFDQRRRAPVVAAESPAALRKAQWAARRERLWSMAVYVSSFVFIAMVTAQVIYAKSSTAVPEPTRITFIHGEVSIPFSAVSDGELHRYSAEVNGSVVRFLIYQKPDQKVVAVADACNICGPVGFYKSGGQIICKNCSAPINAQSVGQAGGCNPIPVRSSVSADSITIREADLAEIAGQMAGK